MRTERIPPSDDAIDALQDIITVLAARPAVADPVLKENCWRRLRSHIAARALSRGWRKAA